MQVAKNTVVTFDYTLTDPAGKVLDSSKGKQPLAYIHGSGGIIAGLERALEGKNPGDKLDVTIAPEDAYGKRDDKLVEKIDRSEFKGVKRLEVGMQFRAQGPGGTRILTVKKFEGNNVVVDGNHPLADVTLRFDVAIVDVREATKDELTHGHVHGPGGHHHH